MKKLSAFILLSILLISSFSIAIQLLNGSNIENSFQNSLPYIVRENGYRVSWSHTFNLIAFDEKQDDGYYDIYVMKPDGTNVRCLTDNSLLPRGHKGCAEWHPSGNYIVFTCQKEKYFGSKIPFLRNWFDKLAVPGIGFNCDLWVMDNNGTKFWRLTDISTKQYFFDKQDYTAIIHPHFSHDGKKLVWSERIGSADNKWGEWCLKVADFIVDENGPHLENIRSYQPGFQPCFYEAHGFSLDDKKIIFSGNLEPGQDENHLDIYTFDLETMTLTRLTETLDEWDEHAHYSPDGRYIVWMSSNGYGMNTKEDWWDYLRTDYWIMKSDGSDKKQLTFYNSNESYRVICSDCSWNPDGTKIAGTILVIGDNYSKGGIIIIDLSNIKNNTIQIWDNSLGPYGGDRKNIVIDPHNPNILFVDSCDNSGVWVSKTAGESTDDPYNPAWQHTKLDRGYTEITGTYDENYTYILAVMMNRDNHVYRLKYRWDEDPAVKDWEETVFTDNMNLVDVTITTDPYRSNRIIIYGLDSETYMFRVFQSSDYGNSWEEIRFTTPPINHDIGVAISDLKFSEYNEDTIYLSLIYIDNTRLSRSILLSYDIENREWLRLSDEIQGWITSFAISDNKIYMTISRSMNHLLLVGERNNDGEYTWEDRDIVLEDGTVLPSTCNARGVTIAPYDNSIIFLGVIDSIDENIKDFEVRGIYKSIDSGNTWRRVAQPSSSYMCYLKENSISFDPVNPNVMYAGMTNFDCIRKSIDYGETWYPITEGLSGINVFGVAIKDNKVYGVVQSAIAINNDSLETNTWVYRQITSPNGRVTANLYGGVEVDPFDSSIVLVGAGHRYSTQSHNGGVFRNTNCGYSNSPLDWERVLYDSNPSDGLDNPQIMDIYFSKTQPGLVFAAAMINKASMSGERGVYISFNHGETWKWIYDESDMYYITQDPLDPGIYYAVGSGENGGGKVIKITIDGNNFNLEESKVVLLDDYFYSIDIQQGLPLEETYAFIGTENGRILRIPLSDLRELNIKNIIKRYKFSLIEGDNIIYEFEKGYSTVVAVNPVDQSEIYVGLYNGGIYRSTDNGLTWYNYSQGLTSSAIDIFELKFSSDGSRLFAGTLGGIATLEVG